MSRQFPELDSVRVSVADDVRERHLAAIGNELRSAGRPRIRRFRLLAVAVALVLALPVFALAAEDAVPGDALYPIKRMLEPVVSLVDRDVAVDHRVREAEILLERDAEPRIIRDHVEQARVVVTDEHPDYAARLDVVADRVREHPDRESATNSSASVLSEESPGEQIGEDGTQQDRPGQTDAAGDSDEKLDHPPRTTTTTHPDSTTLPRDGRGDG